MLRMDPMLLAEAKIYQLLDIIQKGKAMKRHILPILIAAGSLVGGVALADEIQFTTLPQPVQTTVVRETHIASPTNVVRVIHESNGIYAVTVHGDAGDKIVYVTDAGEIVQAPATTATRTTTTEQTVQQPAADTQTVVTYDQIQKDHPRYELVEKKGKKEVYLDHQTGQKIIVKREDK